MTLDADTPGFFSADQYIFPQHQIGDVLEAYRRIVQFKAMSLRDSLRQHRLRKGPDDTAAHLPFTREMKQDQRNDLVHRHRFALFVDRSQTVGIAIRRQAKSRTGLPDARFQCPEIAIDRLGVDAPKQWIALSPDRLHLKLAT